jgi:MoaA/NifB/PqqE/SkfB family radical SAM enzyme
MQIMSGINLEPIASEWKGWQVRGNLLIAPGGEALSVERLWEIVRIQAESRAKSPSRNYTWYWEMLKRKG